MLVTVQTGLPFVWLGLVLGISFVEAPLKFRAPGVTRALGLGIGRIVFRALNRVEMGCAMLLWVVPAVAVLLEPVATVGPSPLVSARVMIFQVLVSVVLLAQVAWLRPALDARAQRWQAEDPPPPSRLHLWYVLLETLKVMLLVALGAVLVIGGRGA
ncbi:hypothetical protein [Longimycelium tulufanense]|uniref:hypothetical protein n=1 Tax=Longimycelium tulufanense TaxID=907463 RepID=UPI001E42668E|nr:hypothetical protein [Longimycelium tulufanense]